MQTTQLTFWELFKRYVCSFEPVCEYNEQRAVEDAAGGDVPVDPDEEEQIFRLEFHGRERRLRVQCTAR
jgi:hypothetical protein